MVLSKDGTKLSTTDIKLAEDGIGGLVCLKFWDSGSRIGEFLLSTVIYEPHRYPHTSLEIDILFCSFCLHC